MEFTKEELDQLATFGVSISMNNAVSFLEMDVDDPRFGLFKGQVLKEFYRYLLGVALEE